MPLDIPMATSAADRLVLGLPEKKCHNVFAEPHPNDPKNKIVLVESAGSLQRNTFASGVRGLWQADGFASGDVLVPQGAVLSTFRPSNNTVSSLTGTVPGSDRVDAAFAENGAVLLADGEILFSDGTYVRWATDGVLDDPNLAIGSSTANVATGAFDFSINGTTYSKGAVAAGTAPGNDVVPTGLYGAVALDIGVDGTIDAIEAPANATGYASASAAAAALPVPADAHIRIGYVTASKSDTAFTFGTTALNAANTTVAYTDSAVNTAFTDLLTDAGETAYTSVAVLGQRALATVGPRFIFGSTGTTFDLFRTTSAIAFYTAESSPDDLIAGRVLGSQYVLFGTRTIEFWALTGDSNDPLAIMDGMTQQVGAACRDGIVGADNTLYFIDHAFNPRRLGSGGSQIINPEDPWVTELLKTAGAANIRGMKEEDKAHTFIIWRTPNGCVAYDVLTQRWHTRGTNEEDSWRYTSMVMVGPTDSARTFVADDDGQFDELSRNYTSESMPNATTDGTYMVRELTAYLPWPDFKAIPAITLKGAKGVGSATGQGSAPVVLMRMSFDRGQTWTSWRSRSIGAQGVYGEPSIWRMNGSAKRDGVIFHFLKSDPVKMAYTGIEDVAA